MRDPKERLRDMLEAIAAIERYLNRGRAGLEQDELLQRWFVSNMQIIGEAARALPDEVRAMAPEVEWHKIIGMRNVLVHGYFDIDLDIVWNAASRDAPALKPRIKKCCGAWMDKDEAHCKGCVRAGRGRLPAGQAGQPEGAGV